MNQLLDEGTPGTRPISRMIKKTVVGKEAGQETLHNGR